MIIKDSEIFEKVEELKKLYTNIMHNQILRRRLLEVSISKDTWINIDELFDNNHLYKINGYDPERIYLQIICLVSFFKIFKNEVVAFIKNMPARNIESMAQQDKILFKMTLGAIDYNVNAFADLVMNLFHIATTADKKAHGQGKAIYKSFPQLQDIMRSLVN